MRCAYCPSTTGPFHRDHVVPRSRGGPDDPINIVMACASCNASKGDLLPSEWRAHVPYLVGMIERRVSAVVAKTARGSRRGYTPPVAPPRIQCGTCSRPLFPQWEGAYLAWWEEIEPAKGYSDLPTPLLDIEILCHDKAFCLIRKADSMSAKHRGRASLLDMPVDAFFGRWAWLQLESLVRRHEIAPELLRRAVAIFRQLSKFTPESEPPFERGEDDDPEQVDD